MMKSSILSLKTNYPKTEYLRTELLEDTEINLE